MEKLRSALLIGLSNNPSLSDKFSISPTEIQRLDGSNVRTQPDFVVVEEPLEIKLVIGQLPTRIDLTLRVARAQKVIGVEIPADDMAT